MQLEVIGEIPDYVRSVQGSPILFFMLKLRTVQYKGYTLSYRARGPRGGNREQSDICN